MSHAETAAALSADPVLTRREALREAFHQTFAAAPATEDTNAQDYVLVRTGHDAAAAHAEGRGYALPAARLAGIEDDCPVVPVPSAATALIGIAGVRGALVPVFDLAALLRGERAIEAEAGRRLSFALASAGKNAAKQDQGQRKGSGRFGQQAQMIGLAFTQLERFVRVPERMLFGAMAGAATARSLTHQDQMYTIVDIAGLVERLTASPSTSMHQERVGAAMARAEDRAQ